MHATITWQAFFSRHAQTYPLRDRRFLRPTAKGRVFTSKRVERRLFMTFPSSRHPKRGALRERRFQVEAKAVPCDEIEEVLPRLRVARLNVARHIGNRAAR